MQIVIDIPEEKYDWIMRHLTLDINFRECNIMPLTKEHGRLIDANELLKMTNSYKSELGRLKADPFVKLGIETVENFIRDLPTIIEADKSESEE